MYFVFTYSINLFIDIGMIFYDRFLIVWHNPDGAGDGQAAERQKAGCWLGGGNRSRWGAGAAVYPKNPEIPVPLVNDIHMGS